MQQNLRNDRAQYFSVEHAIDIPASDSFAIDEVIFLLLPHHSPVSLKRKNFKTVITYVSDKQSRTDIPTVITILERSISVILFVTNL